MPRRDGRRSRSASASSSTRPTPRSSTRRSSARRRPSRRSSTTRTSWSSSARRRCSGASGSTRAVSAALVGVLLGVVLVSGGGTPDAVGIALALAVGGGVRELHPRLRSAAARHVDPMAFAALLTGRRRRRRSSSSARSTGEVVRVGGRPRARRRGERRARRQRLRAQRLPRRRSGSSGPATASLLVTVEVPAGLLFAAVALGERLAARSSPARRSSSARSRSSSSGSGFRAPGSRRSTRFRCLRTAASPPRHCAA